MAALVTKATQAANLPFVNTAAGMIGDKLGTRFDTKDPFYEEVPAKPEYLNSNGRVPMKRVRRQPPPYCSEKQRKLWKAIIRRAWRHDRNCCGCIPVDLGFGAISVISILPIIGSAIAYRMHYKMIKMCHQAGCPASVEAKMVGNIGVDFLLTLIPLLGALFSWLKGSSTRNAALFDTWLRKESDRRELELHNQTNSQHGQLANSQKQPMTPQSAQVLGGQNIQAHQNSRIQSESPGKVKSVGATQIQSSSRLNSSSPPAAANPIGDPPQYKKSRSPPHRKPVQSSLNP